MNLTLQLPNDNDLRNDATLTMEFTNCDDIVQAWHVDELIFNPNPLK